MARSRYKVLDNERPYFLTCTIVNWLSFFSKPEIVQIILDSFRFLQKNGRLTLYAYVIMENHLHLIAASQDLATEIGDFKSYTARSIVDFLKAQKATWILRQLQYHRLRHRKDRQYQFWQEGSHPQQIQNVGMMVQKIEYIHNNPVKRGYVDEPCHWRYSSARNYAGQTGLIDVVTEW